MTRPILNLDDPALHFDDVEENGFFARRAVSTLADVEICEHPDSGKVSVVAGDGANRLRGLHRAAAAVDYDDGEDTSDRGGASR